MDHDSPSPKPSADFGDVSPDSGNIKPHEYESSDLLRGAKEVLIRHAGETYRLRLTRNDKLILQK
ncbi:MAG: hemin uptake protein HemP [Planctomycetota bacterium]